MALVYGDVFLDALEQVYGDVFGVDDAPAPLAVHNLEAFWSLNTDADDDHSHSKNLTNVGTVTFGTDGATFGDGQVLQITGLTPAFEMRLVPGMSSYAVGAIARHTEIPSGDAILVTRQSADDDTDQFKLWYDGVAGQVKFRHRLYRTSTYVTVAIDYTPSVDTPYLAFGWRDSDDDTLHLAVVDADGVTLDSETGATQGLHSSRSLFRIGGGPSGVDSALAEIKAVAFIRDTLSDWTESDFSAWFNSGDGPAYGDLTLADDTINATDAPWESIATVASPWVSTDDLGSRGVFFWSVIDLAEIRPAIAASSGRFAHFWGTNHGNNPATNGIFIGYSDSADEPPASGTKIWAEGANTTEGLQPETPDIEYVADTDLFHLYGHVDRGGGYQATHVRTSSDLVTWSDQSVVAIATEGTDLHTGYADVHQPESFGESTWTASHLRNNYSGFSTSEDGFAPWTRDPETTDESTFAPPGYRVRIADGRFKMGSKVYSLARFSGPDNDAGLCIVEMALENGIYRQPVGVPYRVHTDTEVYPEPGWTIIGRPYVVDNVLSIYRTGGFYRAATPNYEQVDLIAVTWAEALVPDDSRIWQAAVRQTIWRAPKRVTVWRA